ncbi:MAG TPA: hypothetical protein VGQ31_05020 [Candidatus Limnocylindrales bacterium]|nr:hypothetical protein [Candidatus Limnocylindrales bacterium]
MDAGNVVSLTTLAGVGIAGGLVLLVRGMNDYRSSLRVADTATSAIASIAAGEVRISGTIEMAETTLISPLERVPCVYVRITVDDGRDPLTGGHHVTDERSIGFRVRDATGSIRVFPRRALVDAPEKPPSLDGLLAAEPPVDAGAQDELGDPVAGQMIATPISERETWTPFPGTDGSGRYQEVRLEIGDPVTIVGRALPFADLPDPTAADAGTGSDALLDDPEVAADISAATATGSLAGDAAHAWGNAAIPGFGIGHPVSAPSIDPAAHPLPIAPATEAARIESRFAIAPDTLVLAASAEVPLLIAYGLPGEVVRRRQSRFVVGLLGAILAIASAMVLAIILDGGLGT